MKEKSIKIQFWLSVILLIVGLGLLLSAYMGWYIPSPYLSFNLTLLSAGLFGIHVLRKDTDRKKEVMLLLTITLYINLIISSFIYKIWSYETVFTKQGITKMSIFIFLILGIYLTIAYVRARITYKQVKGNQRHNEAWHVSKKDIEEMEKSPDIYINLGIYHEGKPE